VTRAGHGKPLSFIEGIIAAFVAGDDCIDWPYRPNTGGYGRVAGKGAHVLVCELAHGPNPQVPDGPRMQVRHYVCGRPICVNPKHLCWGTAAEDAEDRARHGTALFGERTPSAKLTEQEVRLIRASSETHAALARQLGVNVRTVQLVRKGVTWKHITND
jgi:hypothetical protein